MGHSSTRMADDPQPHSIYAGQFRHSIDEKNRITIPSRWRRADGGAEDFILLPEPRGEFLLVMPPAQFAKTSAEAANDPSLPKAERRVFSRQLHARAQHGASDKQGRLVLPEEICRQLELKGEVALVGGEGRFEIWNLKSWTKAHQEETPTYQHVAHAIGL